MASVHRAVGIRSIEKGITINLLTCRQRNTTALSAWLWVEATHFRLTARWVRKALIWTIWGIKWSDEGRLVLFLYL